MDTLKKTKKMNIQHYFLVIKVKKYKNMKNFAVKSEI